MRLIIGAWLTDDPHSSERGEVVDLRGTFGALSLDVMWIWT
jgi:hypothetical protein